METAALRLKMMVNSLKTVHGNDGEGPVTRDCVECRLQQCSGFGQRTMVQMDAKCLSDDVG